MTVLKSTTIVKTNLSDENIPEGFSIVRGSETFGKYDVYGDNEFQDRCDSYPEAVAVAQRLWGWRMEE